MIHIICTLLSLIFVAAVDGICSLKEIEPLPLPAPLQGEIGFSRSAPIQRLILGPNATSMVVKMHLDDDTTLSYSNFETSTTLNFEDNNGGWQIFSVDLSHDGQYLAYAAADGGFVVQELVDTSTSSGAATEANVYRTVNVDGSTLFDLVTLSPTMDAAISIWSSGIYVHDLSDTSAPIIGNPIPFEPRSALDARIYDGETIAVQFHDDDDNHEIIVYNLDPNSGEWVEKGSPDSHPSWTAAGFSPFTILNDGNTIAYCFRQTANEESNTPELNEVHFWNYNDATETWEMGDASFHGSLQGHPCHSLEFSADRRTVMVQYDIDGQELITVAVFDSETETWASPAEGSASAMILSATHVTDAYTFLGDPLFTMDPTGSFFAGLKEEPHPEHGDSSFYFALYQLECADAAGPEDGGSEFGCYNSDGGRSCLCTPELCSEQQCQEGGGIWTDQCTSCTCGQVSTPPAQSSGFGCYSNQACNCDASVCNEALCAAAGGTFTDRCTSCSCEEIIPDDTESTNESEGNDATTTNDNVDSAMEQPGRNEVTNTPDDDNDSAARFGIYAVFLTLQSVLFFFICEL